MDKCGADMPVMTCDKVLNTRKQQIVADVGGDTCEVVLRGVISSKESRLLTWQPSCHRTGSHKETRELRAVQPRHWVNAFQSGA